MYLVGTQECSLQASCVSCLLYLAIISIVDILCVTVAVMLSHPSQAILGVDIVCQAKSGMGKTAVFVLATLHQLNPQPGEVRG